MTYSLDDYSTSKVERCFVPHDLEKVFGHMSREEIEIHYMSSINSGCPKKGKFTLIGKATKGLHPGLFLQRELGIRKLKSGQFAESIGEHPQTLSSIIRGRRSMNTPLSLRIEQALGLEEGFLMTLQVYYDIAEEKRKLSQNHRPDLTKFRSTIFWDTKIENIDFAAHSRYVINRVFERGNEAEIQEVIQFYGRDAILDNINLKAMFPFENNIKANIKQYLGYEA